MKRVEKDPARDADEENHDDDTTSELPELPSYESVQINTPGESAFRSYTDYPREKYDQRRSYASQDVGPSGMSNSATSRPLFGSWGSKSTASSSLQSLYMDIVQNASITTVEILRTILDTCRKGGISLDSISAKTGGHRPIFWMVVQARKMPGCYELLLAETHRQTVLSLADLKEGRDACLVNDALSIYREFVARIDKLEVSSYRESSAEDSIEVIKTDTPILGYIANISFKDFATRYRVHGNISISFPARHREWTLHLGTSRLPESFLRRNRVLEPGSKVAELFLENGETLPSSATRIRLRHPSHAIESEWLDLGLIQNVTDAMRHMPAKSTKFMAFCGPARLSKNVDWQALEFGNDEFLDQFGTLGLQLQVVAKEVETSLGDCMIQ